MSRPLVIIDTETTSLRRDRRVWEFAMIRYDQGGRSDVSVFVDDVDLSNADPMSLDIGRFHGRHPSFWFGGVGEHLIEPESRVAKLVEAGTRGATIVGAVPNFDTEVLGDMLYRHKLCPAWHYHLQDVETLVAGFMLGIASRERDLQAMGYETASGDATKLKLPSLPWKSEDLSRACGVNPDGFDRHTAMGDCLWIEAQLKVVAPQLIEAAQAGDVK